MRFGAGIWLFGQFVDRYATDAYGPPVSTHRGDRARRRRSATSRCSTSTIRSRTPTSRSRRSGARSTPPASRAWCITPHIYTREFIGGAFTNPDPAVRRRALELCEEGVDVAQAARRADGEAVAGPGRLRLPLPGRLPRAVEARARRRADGGRDGRRTSASRSSTRPRSRARTSVLVDGGAHAGRHRADRPRRRRHRDRPRALAVRQGGARRRALARARPRPALHDRGQRQLARVGRRPHRRLDPPDRDARVLPRGAQDRLGGADPARPVPVPRGPGRGGAHEHPDDPAIDARARPARPRRAARGAGAPGRARRAAPGARPAARRCRPESASR